MSTTTLTSGTTARRYPHPPLELQTVAGLSVADLAARHGTPLFVYDAARIRQRVAQLRGFDVIRYAQKACSTRAILELLRGEGCLVDAVSAGEVERALRAGYPAQGEPPPVVYTADLFDRQALEVVARTGVHVNCGSTDMVDQYGALVAAHPGLDRAITLRLNPGFGAGHSRKVNTGGPHSKHGIWHEELPDALARARRHDLRVVGLHVHIGSGVDLDHLGRVCEVVAGLARQVGPTLETISGGGGLPVPYGHDDPELDTAAHLERWQACRDALTSDIGPVQLEVEPGRFLVAEAGWLIAEVRATKRQGDIDYALVDAGFNDLARPAMYGAYHPISLCAADAGKRPAVPTVVAGPLCESGDVLTQTAGGLVDPRRLPKALVGDLLVVGNCGAYAASMASTYNSRPLAAEVLVDAGQARLIRRRQTIDDLLGLEQ